ncbi:MAG: YidC/Oxa1 family membrane protein insertase [Clostridia bacterium]|nr:YidC/Oxa1 family membrane protein insertase [Clostridia bacterium]
MNLWGIIATPFGYLLKGCYYLTQNYVVSLLLFALIIQALMCLLFGIKQQKNMIKQAKMRPYEMLIRKKYAGRNDQVTMRKQQQEIMDLYQKEGYSPFGGCLPMIIQLIILFPLYEVVRRPLEYIASYTGDVCWTLEQAFGVSGGAAPQVKTASIIRGLSANGGMVGNTHWQQAIQGLVGTGEGQITQAQANAAIDTVNYSLGDGMRVLPDVSLFGADLSVEPINAMGTALWWLIAIPILNLAFTYLSQFVSKKLTYQMNAQQGQGGSMKIMMLFLPLMSMFFTFTFASGIGLYWIFRTLLAMLQQFILAKAMPYPRYTEEDIKRIEKEMREEKRNRGKKPKKVDYETDEYHEVGEDEEMVSTQVQSLLTNKNFKRK